MTSTQGYVPLIAVVAYELRPGRVSRWDKGGFGVPAPYVDALRRAGARTGIIPPGESSGATDLLEPFDGLLLVGGGDVDPARYGAEPDLEHNYGAEPARDDLEIAMVLAAEDLAIPTLCICRGMQVMNVAFGGTLTQHLPAVPWLLPHGVPAEGTSALHQVDLATGTRLRAAVGTGSLACSSHHHQGVEQVGDGLIASGRSPDGLVEAIERTSELDTDPWMVGVQWHPEDTALADPAQQDLFDSLSVLARLRGTRARDGRPGRSRPYAIDAARREWPSLFRAEAERIRAALGDLAIRIEHVGSTSVPGLGAKPVIDIQLSLASLEPRSSFVPALEAIGYTFTPNATSTEHEYLSRGYQPPGERRYHLHVCVSGSEWEWRHVAFRDHLRTHPNVAAGYETLKRQLAAAHPNDIEAYVDGKTAFVTSIEALARGSRDRAKAKGTSASDAGTE